MKDVIGHANRIAREHLEDGIEFANVYEDEQLSEHSEDDWRQIHDLVNRTLVYLAKGGSL